MGDSALGCGTTSYAVEWRLLICLIRAAGAQIRASFGVVRYEALPHRAFDRRGGPSFNQDLGVDVVHRVFSLSFLNFRALTTQLASCTARSLCAPDQGAEDDALPPSCLKRGNLRGRRAAIDQAKLLS